MQPSNGYKTLSIVLGLVAVVFIILYFTKPSQPVSETYTDITGKIEECRGKLNMWQQTHSTTTPTADDQKDLAGILEDCKGVFVDSQEKI